MANLVSVKTLDMVNGEITKVAYGGAEYVKTDSPVQEGDIFLLTEGHLVIGGDTGAFYMANKRPGGGIEIPTRYRGNASVVQKHGNGIAFRKVDAATNPSVEERVAKAEGEIESLKTDVAALKGAVESKPERLKVGDYAKVVGTARNGRCDRGDIVKITEDDDSEVPFNLAFVNGEYAGWEDEKSLVRATDEEVAEAKDAAARAKFKEGGKVRLVSGGGKFPLIGFKNGEIYEVSDNNFDHPSRGKRIRIEGGDCLRGSGCATPDQLEILTEEEAAEIERKQAEEARWAKIGRKVGEYKRGDIARVVDNKCAERVANGDIIEVLKQASGGSVVDTVHGYFLKVELITPVEARFDR
ncbi:hypothetical protein [Bacillus velezensis]|uniref:hypothetical protein n=1 Tax=Bacillus velezensis TaxID=492670 RepID=UPI001F3BCA4D|nr:hypothetical protein [Bacillus velezensis]MCE4941064.1 hypothetical protein [Bacillus velezensis]